MAILSFFTKPEPHTDYPQLNQGFLEEPPSVLAQALLVSDDIIKDILSLAAFVCNMPIHCPKGNGKLLKVENINSHIEKKLALLDKYLRSISYGTLSHTDSHAVEQLIRIIHELGLLTEHLAHIAIVSKTVSRLRTPLSFAAKKELSELWSCIDIILKTLEEGFLNSNYIPSMWILEQNSMIQEQIKALKKNHISRLRSGSCNIETGIYFLDLLYDYEQIVLHCTALFHETFIMNTLEERKG